ncbi:cytochrome c [Sulfurivirga sp.]|uniref:c-type cytochrome n=1 Tax=Sulfurivirga sp. TaxID=2614236 RepID=UPI0025D8D07C|nr:cytochrome c [Sulfurivirga sp.]
MDWIALYPTWYDPAMGSGYWIALIATIHVVFSHASVGAAIFFAWLINKAYREDRPELLTFVKRYGLFLLIFSYVMGSITGPGIWYSTTVGSPKGISALIHSFVWKWATEWVFFVIEVVGVYMLIYLVGKVDKRTHTLVAFIFAGASYATMMLILGILSFMMWPGSPEWFAKGGTFYSFFGPNTFAQLLIRTGFAMAITAVVGSIVASAFKDAELKREVLRKLAAFGLLGSVIMFVFYFWYLHTIPENAVEVFRNRMPGWFYPAVVTSYGLMVIYFLTTLFNTRILNPVLASIMLVVVTFMGLFPTEITRESMRKPYVAGQYVYSNQIIARDVPGMDIHAELPKVAEKGILKVHPFLPENYRTITDENRLEVGRQIAIIMCSNCHQVTRTEGIRPLTDYLGGVTDVARIKRYLQGTVVAGNIMYMPRIPLKPAELDALAAYLADLNAHAH